jgi:hypothetical protein
LSPAVAILAIAVTACAQEDGRVFGTSMRDSAGVQIVDNRGHGGAATRWVAAATPMLRLGAPDAPAPEQFLRVAGAIRLGNGTVVVAERSQGELRFFAPDGAHVLTTGGRGDGPAEFRLLDSMVRGPGDSILVSDERTMGYSVFAPTGEFVRAIRPDIAALRSRFQGTGRICSDSRLFPDGTVLWCAAAPELEAEQEPPVLDRSRSSRLVRLHLDTARVDYLALYLGIESYKTILDGNNHVSAEHPFYSTTHMAVGTDPMRLYLANNPRYEIEVWDPEGSLIRIIRRLDAPLVATDEEAREALAVMKEEDRFADRMLAEFPVPIPGTRPAVHGLTPGPDGELWVEQGPFMPSDSMTVFDVFDGEGVFLGPVRLRRDIDLLDVGHDYILSLRLDELDVPIVELYELDRGGA